MPQFTLPALLLLLSAAAGAQDATRTAAMARSQWSLDETRQMAEASRAALETTQGDPADSLYRTAREVFNGGDYRRAAQLFSGIHQNYPKSAYLRDSQYYEALSRYYIGTTDQLQAAAKILEPIVAATPAASTPGAAATTPTAQTSGAGGFASAGARPVYVQGANGSAAPTVYTLSTGRNAVRLSSESSIRGLYTRIIGTLAQRGDRDAAERVAKLATQSGTRCDASDMQVRVEAMNALSQMDPTAGTTTLRRVLDRKDECSSDLRRRAIFMLGRTNSPEAAQLIINTAKSDPSEDVRIEAINALSRLPGDAGFNALDEMLRSEQNERVQRAVVGAIGRSDNPRARPSLRTLIDRKDVSTNVRLGAISALWTTNMTADDASYLRGVFDRTTDERVKAAILSFKGNPALWADTQKWLLGVAENQNESSNIRQLAISQLIRSNVSIGDLNKLYDNATSSNTRTQIISVLAQRKESEATDKLIDIVRNSTVLSQRTQAINALAKKNDPRATQLLNNLLDGKQP